MDPSPTALERYRALISELGKLDGAVVAYSGGVDSSVLARAAYDALGNRMLAVLATSPLLPATEAIAAVRLAEEEGFPLMVTEHSGFEDPSVRENRTDRCYHCKAALARSLRVIADERGFEAVLHGENADDLDSTDRPGAIAAREVGVLSPLADAGLTKTHVRTIARAIDLANADKPATPCLATRIRTDQPLAGSMLARVERVEDELREAFGFSVLRVRVDGATGRVQVGTDEVPLSLANRLEIERILINHGFRSAHVDADGYRSGS